MKHKMTYEELLTTDKVILTCEEAAGILGCTPQLLRIRARDPEKRKTLGFPVMAVGSRVKVPVKGLIKFLEGGEFIIETSADRTAKRFYDELLERNISQKDQEQIVIKLSEFIYDNAGGAVS